MKQSPYRCSVITRDGEQCRNHARPDSEGMCGIHRGGRYRWKQPKISRAAQADALVREMAAWSEEKLPAPLLLNEILERCRSYVASADQAGRK